MTELEIDRMSLEEYGRRMKGAALSLLDRKKMLSETAWFAQRYMTAYDKDYRYIIKEFEDLFDFDGAEEAVFTGKSVEKKRTSELEERFNKAQYAREQARKLIEERRKLDGTN